MKDSPIFEQESTRKERSGLVGGWACCFYVRPKFSDLDLGVFHKRGNFLTDRPAGGERVAYPNSTSVGVGLPEANVKMTSVLRGTGRFTLL